MTQVTQQQPVLNFNDKEYVINELSVECQSCLIYIQEIDQKVNELNRQLVKEQITKQGFETLLGQHIVKMEQEKEASDKEADEKPAE